MVMDLNNGPGRDAYDNYSRWGVNDPNAPVKASGEIVVDASSQKVWEVLSDVRSWPRLRPDIDDVKVNEDIKTGSSCTLSTVGVELTLTFGLVSANRELNWVTAMPGLVMTNRYVLVPCAHGTRIVCSETINAPAFPELTQAALAHRIQVWLAAVKVAAEGQFDAETIAR